MSDSAALVVLIILVCSLLAGFGGWGVSAWHSRKVLTSVLRKVVGVTTKSGETFKGVLVEHDDQAFVLRDARQAVRSAPNEWLSVDGDLILLREDVDYIQRP